MTSRSLCALALGIASTLALADAKSEYLEAARQFESLVVGASKESGMPRHMNQEASRLLSILSDSERFLKPGRYQASDLNALLEMCGAAHKIFVRYAVYNAQSIKDDMNGYDDVQMSLRLSSLMEKNIVTYQAELAPISAFSVRCFAASIPLTSEFMQSLRAEDLTEVRKRGARKMLAGALGIYLGNLQEIHNQALGKSYRATMMRALAESARFYAPALPLAQRKQITSVAQAAMAREEFKEELREIVDAMGDPKCTSLCQFK